MKTSEKNENEDYFYRSTLHSLTFYFQILPLAEQEVPSLTHSSNVCGLWDGDKVYTFDGSTYRSGGKCQYTLVSDCTGGSFEVSVQWSASGRPQVKVGSGDNYVKFGSDGAFFNGDE